MRAELGRPAGATSLLARSSPSEPSAAPALLYFTFTETEIQKKRMGGNTGGGRVKGQATLGTWCFAEGKWIHSITALRNLGVSGYKDTNFKTRKFCFV